VILLILGIAVGLGWLLWEWKERFQWDLFLNTFRGLDLRWIVGAALFALATYLGRALRWRILIRPQKARPSLWNLFTATSIGFTAIVLFGRPGEMVRPYLIALKERLSFSSQMAAWLLERIYDLMMALFIFGFALSHVRGTGVKVGEGLQWVLQMGGYAAGFVALVCVIVFVALRQFGEKSESRILDGAAFLPDKYHGWLVKVVRAFRQGVESTKDWAAVVKVFGYSVLEWILIVACYICVFQASPETAGLQPLEVLIFVGFVSFGAVIQIPGIGGGMQVVAVVILTELFGMPLEVSTGIAVVLWAITFVVIVPIGLLLAFHDGLNWSKLRHLEEENPRPL